MKKKKSPGADFVYSSGHQLSALFLWGISLSLKSVTSISSSSSLSFWVCKTLQEMMDWAADHKEKGRMSLCG